MVSPPEKRPQEVSVVTPDRSRITLRRHHCGKPPWTPPSSVKKNCYTDVLRVEPTQGKERDGFKQTEISFNGGQTNHRQRRRRESVSEAKNRPERPPNRTIEENDQQHMDDMFSTAKKVLHYQLSHMKEDQSTNSGITRPQGHNQQPARQRQPFSVLQTNSFRNDETKGDREPIATTLPTGDPRAYLLRRQKSMAAEDTAGKLKKLRRLKSFLMPLENTPPEHHTHNLSWAENITSSGLGQVVQQIKEYDEYVIYGVLVDGLDMGLADGQIIETRLQKLLAEQKENIDGGRTEDIRAISLQTALKGKNVIAISTK
jgi:hypothetical protein